QAAAGLLDGWTGVLGRCLVVQEWRQDFDYVQRIFLLPLLPVMSVSSVTYAGSDGSDIEVDPKNFALVTSAGGYSHVVVRDASINGPVSITYKAGYPTIPEVPAEGDK